MWLGKVQIPIQKNNTHREMAPKVYYTIRADQTKWHLTLLTLPTR